jgi:hypothetical protein
MGQWVESKTAMQLHTCCVMCRGLIAAEYRLVSILKVCPEVCEVRGVDVNPHFGEELFV